MPTSVSSDVVISIAAAVVGAGSGALLEFLRLNIRRLRGRRGYRQRGQYVARR